MRIEQNTIHSFASCIRWAFTVFHVIVATNISKRKTTPGTGLRVHQTKVFLNVLHVLFDLSTREVIRSAVLLNALRVAPRENELELLLLTSRPNVVVDLVVFSPHLESLIVVDLEEMVTHLVIR